MRVNKKDLDKYLGTVFNNLTIIDVIKETGVRNYLRCECVCGKTDYYTNLPLLTSGDVKSCGCKRADRLREVASKHGNCSHPLYSTWDAIRYRCYNPKSSQYKDYGGRGIVMSDEWLNDFLLFVKEIGPKPTPEHTIERKDVDGNYCKENCEWASRKEQANNRRDNCYLELNGKSKTITEWSSIYNINYMTVRCRLNRGWTVEEALTKQTKNSGRHKNKE